MEDGRSNRAKKIKFLKPKAFNLIPLWTILIFIYLGAPPWTPLICIYLGVPPWTPLNQIVDLPPKVREVL